MMAILLEHTSGKWPFWLSPRQSVILPVTDDHYDYAKEVHAQLQKQRYALHYRLLHKTSLDLLLEYCGVVADNGSDRPVWQ
jgi:threonyl-tRNA synthetase